MGATLAPGRFQGGSKTLSQESLLVARVVPDVSGIDKEFDYLVPERLRGKAEIGCRVRVDLHGRRVGGWIVALGASLDSEIEPGRMREIASVSGAGVEPSVVDLTSWVAEQWHGHRRAVLASASAPTMRDVAKGSVRRQRSLRLGHPVADVARSLFDSGGGCVRVPPLDSALFAVVAAAERGPTIVICPTVRMAALAGGWLRRQQFSVAVMPEDWSRARAGVDIVIGARSAVFAPCPDLAAIVVVDEHDEALKEERNPTWDALAVAQERGQRAGIPVISTSPVPTARTHLALGMPGHALSESKGWPIVSVVDISDVSPAGSLLSSELLDACRDQSSTTVCVLNTVGVARVVTCRQCRAVQRCAQCRSHLAHLGTSDESDSDQLWCATCNEGRGAICVECGRPSFLLSRLGTAGLVSQIARGTKVTPVEVTATTSVDHIRGGVFVGTEAVLNRISTADVVVFADLDRDLAAPRVTAPREVLALLVRAARIVGSQGRMIVQTRDPAHPVWRAITASSPDVALAQWCESDLETRRLLGMPPFAVCARLSVETSDGADVSETCGQAARGSVDISRESSDKGGRSSFVVRAQTRGDLMNVIDCWEQTASSRPRVYIDPLRY